MLPCGLNWPKNRAIFAGLNSQEQDKKAGSAGFFVLLV